MNALNQALDEVSRLAKQIDAIVANNRDRLGELLRAKALVRVDKIRSELDKLSQLLGGAVNRNGQVAKGEQRP